MDVGIGQRPFGGAEQTRPDQTHHHLGHQEVGPVVANFRRVAVGQADLPAVPSPGGGGDQHKHIALDKLHLRQQLPITPAHHQHHADDGHHRTDQLIAPHPLAVKQGAHGQHEHRRARRHQGHIDRGGGAQGQVLKGVVTSHAQQAQEQIAPPVGPQRAVRVQHAVRQRQQQHQRHQPAQQVECHRRDFVMDHAPNHRIG